MHLNEVSVGCDEQSQPTGESREPGFLFLFNGAQRPALGPQVGGVHVPGLREKNFVLGFSRDKIRRVCF